MANNVTNPRMEIEALERRFWQSMVDGQPEVATRMLHEPAVLVSARGANKFDRAQYAQMAQDDRYRLVDFAITGMDVLAPTPDAAIATYSVHLVAETEGRRREEDYTDSSTWVKVDGAWQCVLHTESAVAPSRN